MKPASVIVVIVFILFLVGCRAVSHDMDLVKMEIRVNIEWEFPGLQPEITHIGNEFLILVNPYVLPDAQRIGLVRNVSSIVRKIQIDSDNCFMFRVEVIEKKKD